MLAQFTVLSRLKEPENSNIYSKMRVYDGENLKDTDPKAKSIQEYRDNAGVDEGMNGLSTRFAFKILSKVFNFDPHEIAANPVHLLYVLEQQIEQEQFQAETRERYLRFLKEYLAPRYIEFIGKEIQTAYLSPTANMARTSSTAMCCMQTSGSRTRNTATRKPARYSTAWPSTRNWKNRETSRHQQSEGLPQRNRQLRAARPGQQQRQEPNLAQL